MGDCPKNNTEMCQKTKLVMFSKCDPRIFSIFSSFSMHKNQHPSHKFQFIFFFIASIRQTSNIKMNESLHMPNFTWELWHHAHVCCHLITSFYNDKTDRMDDFYGKGIPLSKRIMSHCSIPRHDTMLDLLKTKFSIIYETL